MSHPYSHIPELMNLEAGRGIVRIPVELDVPFTPRVRALVDTAEFQRLSHISQLGLAARVYPGATHTRFEHALGVFWNALKYLWQLGRDLRFSSVVDRHGAEVLMVSALLHDLGHWPFCHPIEDMALPELLPHEAFAAEFLRPERELARVLRDDWHVEPAEVLDVLAPRTNSAPLRLMRSILSGPIDIDKMDYLDRDSLHCGVPYGRHFDKQRLIQSLLVNETGDGLALSAKGKTAAELMVFARCVMFSEVYWHHAVRSATAMFARSFFELRQQFDLKSFFQLTESETIHRLRQAAHGTESESLVEGVFGPKRRLFKRVVEYSHSLAPELYQQLAGRPYAFHVRCGRRMCESLSSLLGRPLAPVDILIDAPPPHREVEFDVSIYFPKEQVYRPLHRVSPVVDALAKTQFDDFVKRVRVFAEPKLAQELSKLPSFHDELQKAISTEPPS
jgi:HD superfamily phosphohydrolase